MHYVCMCTWVLCAVQLHTTKSSAYRGTSQEFGVCWFLLDNVSEKRVSFWLGVQMFQFGGIGESFGETVRGKSGVEGRLELGGECWVQSGG